MEIYFDNAATTRPFPEVMEEMTKVALNDYGNPSSKHMKGVEAENHIRRAKEIIASAVKCKEKEIVFTSGATESNNMAIFGGVRAKKRAGKHIITSAMEHPSVREPFLRLEQEGYDVTFLPVDKRGIVDLQELRNSLREDTVLVSVMHVNNETGIIEPVKEIGEIIKEYNQDIYFHVDAVQAFGKVEVIPKNIKADLLSVSAHKFHGPKGTGFLYIRDGVRILPLLEGGGQQNKLRSGTENVPGIAGMGKAVEMIAREYAEKKEELKALIGSEWELYSTSRELYLAVQPMSERILIMRNVLKLMNLFVMMIMAVISFLLVNNMRSNFLIMKMCGEYNRNIFTDICTKILSAEMMLILAAYILANLFCRVISRHVLYVVISVSLTTVITAYIYTMLNISDLMKMVYL